MRRQAGLLGQALHAAVGACPSSLCLPGHSGPRWLITVQPSLQRLRRVRFSAHLRRRSLQTRPTSARPSPRLSHPPL